MMLCSSCSELIRPVVAIDIDGTLGDYHGHFIRFAEDYLGRSAGGGYTGDRQFKAWGRTVWNVDERTWKDIKLAYRQGAQKRSMPIYPGAYDLCDAVRVAGAELWLTTTRPYLRLDNVDPDTRAWLDRHGIIYDGLLYDENKYHRLAEQIDPDRVVAVVDDLPEMFADAAAVFGAGTPIFRGTSYNLSVSVDGVVESDLDRIRQRVVERIDGWKMEGS